MIRTYKFSFDQLEISTEAVEEILGYEPGQSPEPFPRLIETVISRCNELCDIKGELYISKQFSVNNNGFRIGDTDFYTGKKISAQLDNSYGAALFICTAGERICEYSSELMAKGDLLEGYIYDVIGSLTVENAMNRIHDFFEADMKKNKTGVTNRYSPGYCEWKVDEQQKLFSFFPESFSGVKLSDSSLMNPVKSVSGIIGFGQNAKRKKHECNLCNLEHCIYRKQRKAG
jgi:hypothetical protein